MQRLVVSGAVQLIYRSLGVKGLTSWNPLGHSRPVMGLIYLLHALYNLSFSFTITFTFNNHKIILEIHHNFDNNIFF